MTQPSLQDLRRADFLESWVESVAADRITAVRRILETMVDRFCAGPHAPTSTDPASVLRDAVLALNTADTGFICTIEREDLCEYLLAAGEAAGIRGEDIESAIDLREW
jgi:hypothetical protein